MAILTASTSSQLTAALASVRGGDTIILDGGNYGHLDLNTQRQPNLEAGKTIKIASADSGNPAAFDSMLTRDASHITLDGLKFDLVTDPSTSAGTTPFRVEQSDHITIRNAIFSGDDYKGPDASKAGYGAGYGLRIIKSQDVTLENSEFSGFRIGTTFGNSQSITARNNTYYDLSGDAMKFAAVQEALVEGNNIGNFRSNADDSIHRDMIQFLTNNTGIPSSDIIIRGNVLHSGSGPFTQSIFMGNEEVAKGRAGQEMYYRNILIEDNLIYNAQAHGITLGAADGLVIRNNTVLHNTAAGDHRSVHIPKINVDALSLDVRILDNITAAAPDAAKAGWTVAGNLLVQRTDPLGETYYDALFVAANRPDAPVEALQALPGGLIEALGVGAEMTRFDATPDTLTALARQVSDRGEQHFDAGLSADPSGLTGGSATYRWDFGDGQTAKGQNVSHSYDAPGNYEVTLRVSKDGISDSFTFTAQASDPLLLSLRFGADGPDDASSYDAPVELRGDDVAQTAGSFHLTDGNYAVVDRDQSKHLHALEDFTLSFDLQRDSATTDTGRIMGIKSSWGVRMEKDGRVSFDATGADGKSLTLTSKTAITDTGWHNARIEYSATAGEVAISIDGKASATADVDGPTPSLSSYGLMLGWPWGASFNGRLRKIDIIAQSDAVAPPPGGGGSGGSGTGGGDAATLDEIQTMIEDGDHAGLAASLSKTLITSGGGDNSDNVVLADPDSRFLAATARGGDNVLIGDDRDNWLVDGPGDNIMHGGRGADEFRFAGADVGGADVILDMNFAEGDLIVLKGYADGTFAGSTNSSGATVFSEGGSVRISTLEGLAGLARDSSAVTAGVHSDGDRLVLEIAQGAGTHQIEMTGMAAAWLALGDSPV